MKLGLMMIKIITALILSLSLTACGVPTKTEETPKIEKKVTPKSREIQFAVMGHIHAWFKNFIVEELRTLDEEGRDYVFLTGDIVLNSDDDKWGEVSSVLENLTMETHIAPGNHDLSYKDPATNISKINYGTYERYNGKSYGAFKTGSNVFITVDSITNQHLEDQKTLFDQQLSNLSDVKNVFVFSHYLQFITTGSKYECLRGHVHFDKFLESPKSNIWVYLKTKLKGENVDLYYFAGDIGVKDHLDRIQAPLFYDETENIKIYAAGMGNPLQSYFDVKVSGDKVDVKIVPFDKSIEVNLVDYTLDSLNYCTN